jgi:arsenate reductase
MKATIYHNPACGTSRNVLAALREAGIEPEIVEYLRDPPTRGRLVELIHAAGLTVRGAMRDKGELYEELGLANPRLTDDQLLDAMMAHPILINRPIVVTPKGTRLCRPADKLREILPGPQNTK